MVWLRSAGVASAVALASCGVHVGVASRPAPPTAEPALWGRLLSGDDVPAGYRPVPPAADGPRRWCGGGSLDVPNPRQRAAEVLVSRPDPTDMAVLTDTIMVFAPGDGARYVAALRADEQSCARPRVALPEGLTIEGDQFVIDLATSGDEQTVTDVRGTAIAGPGQRIDASVAHIVVRRGDVVAVIDDAVAGIQLDTGFRDRLARRAADQVGAAP